MITGKIKPVHLDDLIEDIRLDLILDLDVDLQRDPGHDLIEEQRKQRHRDHDDCHARCLVGLDAGNDIDQVLAGDRAYQRHDRREDTQTYVEEDLFLIILSIGAHPFEFFPHLMDAAVLDLSDQHLD